MSACGDMPAWQRQRAVLLHSRFRALEERLQAGACKLVEGLDGMLHSLAGVYVGAGDDARPLRISKTSLQRAWYRWRDGGKSPEALALEFKPGRTATPRPLIRELQRRATLPGMTEHSVAIDSLRRDWEAGRPLPGIGTWRDWWGTNPATRGLPMPDRAPEFFAVVSRSTLYRWAPDKPTKAGGTQGKGAAKKHLPYARLNYSKLRKGELYTLDDVRLDIVVLDDATGRATTVVCYVMMEVGSRYVPAYLAKPAESIRAEDVDELVEKTLRVCGVGVGYQTHILFERGTVACSEAAQALLEGMTDHALKVHRTGMVGGVQWVGAPAEKRVGNAAAKGVIESFNRQLHLLLRTLPGQRGSSYETQPASLGYTGGRNKDGSSATHRGSLVDEAERLAQFEIATGRRCRLHLPMLYFSELDSLLREAMRRHNSEPGHAYSGHGRRRQVEVAPGIWEDRPDILSNLPPSTPHRK